MIEELVTQDWVNESLITDFYSPEIDTSRVTRSICFQGVATGSPAGTMSVEVSIIPDEWETLQGCESISEDMSLTNKFYFVLPNVSDYGSTIRLSWKAGSGSSGDISVALRILPN